MVQLVARAAMAGNERRGLEQAGTAARQAARKTTTRNRDGSRSPNFWPRDQLFSPWKLVFDPLCHSNDAQAAGIVWAWPQERRTNPDPAQSCWQQDSAETVRRVHTTSYQRSTRGNERRRDA